MNKYLEDIAIYVNDRINIKELNKNTYISTDNMIENIGGIRNAEYMPTTGTATKFIKGDILLSNIRPYLKKVWKAKFDGGCSNDVLVLRAKNGDSDFLFSLITMNQFFDYDMKGTNGSKMPRGDKNHIMKYPFSASINEQKIGSIIRMIDDIIEFNNQIIPEIDKCLKSIFNYSFYSEATRNNTLPLNKNKYVKIIKPGVEKFEIKTYLATADVDGEKILNGKKIDYDNRENRANMQPIDNSIWFAKLKNTIKHITLLEDSSWFNEKYILSTGFLGIESSKEFICYMNCIVNYTNFENIKDKISHGATQEGINNDDLSNIIVYIPSENELHDFYKKTSPLIKKKSEIIKENKELRNFRDYVLPLLMSSQIK